MSAGVYVTTADILGGADVLDEWGYPAEGNEVLAAGVPITITEGRQVVATESDPQAVAVHYYTGRVPAGTVVTSANRIRTSNGDLYMVDYVATPASPVIPEDVRLDLRRVT